MSLGFKRLSFSLCRFLQSPVTSSLLKPLLHSAKFLTSCVQISEYRQRRLANRSVWPKPYTTHLYSCRLVIFIDCSWVSNWWQRSVDRCKNSKETAKGETVHKTIEKHRIHKTGKTNINSALQNISRIIRK